MLLDVPEMKQFYLRLVRRAGEGLLCMVFLYSLTLSLQKRSAKEEIESN
jgi:hypothetical protein